MSERLQNATNFPPVETALREPNGLLAMGGDLSVERLLDAYRHGIFPWFNPGEPILWWSPDPRMVLVPGEARHREILFSEDSDPSQELWTGRVPGFDEVSARSGIGEVASNARFRDFLRAAMEGGAWGDTATYRSFATAGLPNWRRWVV